MTTNIYLNWAGLAVSLANVILLLWLGLTVLLNAERRSWDVWLAGSGLLLGSAFFISHTAILGYGPFFFDQELNLWWYLGWGPVVMLPFAWYVMMLWYTGYWPNLGRQRGWLILTGGLLLILISLLLLIGPLPALTQVIQLQPASAWAIGGVPFILGLYPLYVVLCIALAIHVLRHPAPSPRLMGEQARRRARPWLLAASAIQLSVSLLVAAVILWVIATAGQLRSYEDFVRIGLTVAWLDLLIALLIGLATILLGQAIVAYAVFTGKNLPRQEFRRQWLNTIILALGYGTVVGGSLALDLLPIYSLLLTTLLMTLFYALLIWRSYTWRERYIRHLRPFVSSHHLYDHLLTPSTTPPDAEMKIKMEIEVEVSNPFRALCEDILGAEVAHLLAVGPLAPLVGPVSYPAERQPPPQTALAPLIAADHSPQTICLPLDPATMAGVVWAVPLWSERGRIGLLLLGPKQDGGLYSQEELEIARAGGERLIDTRASAEVARRLMALQRRRLTESQLLDRRTRQVLHDDILPRLHTALLHLSAAPEANGHLADTVSLLTGAHQQISNLLREMPPATSPAIARRGLVGALRTLLEDELPDAFEAVTWQIDPTAEAAARRLPPLTAEVLFYAARETLRNAARHARGDDPHRPLHLTISLESGPGLTLRIEDDGVGLAQPLPAGEQGGHGLALHSTMLAVVGGTLDVDSLPGRYTRVAMVLHCKTIIISGMSGCFLLRFFLW